MVAYLFLDADRRLRRAGLPALGLVPPVPEGTDLAADLSARLSSTPHRSQFEVR
jgi:hypothetical protein